jgi:hypothetical protein
MHKIYTMSKFDAIRAQLAALEAQAASSTVDASTQTEDPNAEDLNYMFDKVNEYVSFQVFCSRGNATIVFTDIDEPEAPEEYPPTPTIIDPPLTPEVATPDIVAPPSPTTPDYNEACGSPLKKMRIAEKQPKQTARCNRCGLTCTDDEIEKVFGWKNDNNRKVRQSWCRTCRHSYRTPKYEKEDCSQPGSPHSVIMERAQNIYLINDNGTGNNAPPSSRITMKLKSSTETWEDAEVRMKKKNMPIIRKRDKLLKIIANQEGISVMECMMKYSGITTAELFFRVKNSSPEMITSKAQSDDEESY